MPKLSKLILGDALEKGQRIPILHYQKGLTLNYRYVTSEIRVYFSVKNIDRKENPSSFNISSKTSKSESLKSSTIVHKSSPHFVIIIMENVFAFFSA
jgi:hypothetical protein